VRRRRRLWNLLATPLREQAIGAQVHRPVDLWHLREKLGRAAAAIPGGSEGAKVMERWKLNLLNRSSARHVILRELRQSDRSNIHVVERRPVHEAMPYLVNNGDHMDYAAARRNGLPVGSGNVEATCKSLVEARMKRPGARWKETSGEQIIQLRAVGLSDRWDSAIALTLLPLRQ
jgi:hypothetical protein